MMRSMSSVDTLSICWLWLFRCSVASVSKLIMFDSFLSLQS